MGNSSTYLTSVQSSIFPFLPFYFFLFPLATRKNKTIIMTIFTSKYPSLPIPQTGIVQTLFESKFQNEKPDRVCYVDVLTGRELTFRQLKDMIYRFAAGLQDVCGFKKGDVLALYAPNLV